MKFSAVVIVLGIILIAAISGCTGEKPSDWFPGTFHAVQSGDREENQIYFLNDDKGQSDIYILYSGKDLTHYKGNWDSKGDTIILSIKSKTGDLVDEANLIREDGQLKVVASNFLNNVSLSPHQTTANGEEVEPKKDAFLNTLFLVDKISAEDLVIGDEEEPVFMYFERGKADFLLTRAFLGCQISSATISPTGDDSYRIYPFPRVRANECPQIETEIAAREAYSKADRFDLQGDKLILYSGEEPKLELRAIGPIK